MHVPRPQGTSEGKCHVPSWVRTWEGKNQCPRPHCSSDTPWALMPVMWGSCLSPRGLLDWGTGMHTVPWWNWGIKPPLKEIWILTGKPTPLWPCFCFCVSSSEAVILSPHHDTTGPRGITWPVLCAHTCSPASLYLERITWCSNSCFSEFPIRLWHPQGLRLSHTHLCMFHI